MLQVTIEHHKDETVFIQKICEGDNILAEMQSNNVIDLDVCVPYINQEINVQHNYVDDTDMSYALKAKLEAVEMEPTVHAKCIRYSVLEKIGG